MPRCQDCQIYSSVRKAVAVHANNHKGPRIDNSDIMARTRRKRKNRKVAQRSQALDHEESVIKLRKFMSRKGFNDEINFRMRNFPDTGRGVSSLKTLQENDILITVPFELMITYATLKKVNFLHHFNPTSQLTIHDLLATFLVLEKHKKDSYWAAYINSLPRKAPWIPALLSEQHTKLLPLDLRLAAKKSRTLLDDSWARIQRSIKSDWTCTCCGKKARCVIDLHSFTWGYILVNTRAVYANPQVIRELCDWTGDVLSDEPCMALCPFLDMFNHSDKAGSRADLIYKERKLVYQLWTLTEYKKYEQVFISYGEHDNIKLLTEYGFFVPGNCYDCIAFQSKEVVKVLRLNIGDFQYKFICEHDLDKNLSISKTGASFNLKSFLFIGSRASSEVRDLASVVYTDNYPDEFLENELKEMCHKLLLHQLELFDDNLKIVSASDIHSLVVDFLRYRRDFVQGFCDNTCL